MSGPCWCYSGGSCPPHGDQGRWRTREEPCLPSSRLLVQEYTMSGSAAWRRYLGDLARPATAVAWQTTGTAVPRPPTTFATISRPTCTSSAQGDYSDGT